MTMIKDKLSEIATKYKVTLTYGENSAEFTDFQGETRSQIATQKIDIQCDLDNIFHDANINDYKVISGFNPDKLTISWRQE
jgi:hypothetical protein